MSRFESCCILTEEFTCENDRVPSDVHHVNMSQSIMVEKHRLLIIAFLWEKLTCRSFAT